MKHAFLLLAVCVLILGFTVSAQVPNKISYQGFLATSTGTPVTDGNYNLKLDIYNLPTGGTILYTQTITGITVSKGTFSVILSSLPEIFNKSLFVQVTALAGSPDISSDAIFSPRSELTSAPYALNSIHSDTAAYVANALPLSGGEMTGPITSTGNPSITMGKGNFGSGNTNTGENSFVAGSDNVASGDRSTVVGGEGNSATFGDATVLAGNQNVASNVLSIVVGGAFNTSGGVASLAAGGLYNNASGNYSFAIGRRAKAIHKGAFVWADPTDEDFTSTGENQFIIRASGGVGIGTVSPREKLEIAGNLQMPDQFYIKAGDAKILNNYGNQSIFMGINAGNIWSTGSQNIGLGIQALSNVTSAQYCTAVGSLTLNYHHDGDHNTAVGYGALFFNEHGRSNTAIGTNAGTNSTGSGNVFVGAGAGMNETGDDKLYISNNSDNNLIYGDFIAHLVGINQTAPTASLDVTGSTGYNQLRLRTSFTPTGTADTQGNIGDIAWDANYVYIKTSAGWKRSALTTW